MRVLVVSEGRLSSVLLARSVDESPDSQVVGQVSHLRDAQTWCHHDKADAVLADAEIVAREIITDNLGLATRLRHGLSAQDGLKCPVLGDLNLDTRAFDISVQQVGLLSTREREVFLLLGLGFSNRRIARSLDIVESTVKSHVGQVLGKLGIESRLEAGLAAFSYLLSLSNDKCCLCGRRAGGAGMNDDRTQRWDSPAANHYDRYRPGPAEAAVRWLVPSHCQLAVDVGAGTGGLTRLLLIQGIRVVAVEPDGHMLRVLADACPAAAAVQGTGEVLPVKTAAADAVVVSSAWHWMRPEAATREAERVLQPGGIFGIVYNSRDKTVPWVADIEQFLRKLPLVARREAAGPARDPDNDSPVARERSDQLLKPGLSGTFTQPRTTCISWAKPMTPAEIAGFFTSYYGILSLPRHLRHQLAVQLNMYISEHPRLSGRENVDFPMISTCWQVRRVADGLSPLQVPSGERLPASLPPYAGVPSPIAIPGRQRP